MEFIDVIKMGGPSMYAILAVSIVGLAVVLERIWFYAKSWTNPELLERKLGELLYKGDAEAAASLVREKESSLHRLFRAAIDHWLAPPEALKMLLEQEVRHELYRWEKGLTLLSTVARVTPLLGLLGTVLGIVDVFRSVAESEGPTNMALLASGIWEALLTTVAGLAVAIPAVLCYSWFSSKIDALEESLWRGSDFILREKMLRGRTEHD
ncbi:biopolymer transport protein ExbB [Acetomicrobium thermoterrenum DSM 13490]|uniref:Biopolymer transport protein ExbB n=1 Tax=Acetomicrobium thermoterrenum DSM 13490 TaxID=1120987 RepID=A0A1H3H6Z0_9BACT|nr:MotA/TolQ/ExbB proton channel family protein [Acetomicrobium thermoterrenum]SDY11221.1 biopolymer transport protein ExbB [Acetomicrobium thermoterrenum DSM 13490]